MWAILSDVHANLEALTAVLEDIDGHGVERVYCLGDTLGYGPNPCECLDLVMEHCDVVLLGNHDQATMFHPEGFGAPAEKAVTWGREQIEQRSQSRDRRWSFLAERPRTHREGLILFVHGSPRNPLNEYVFPEDIYNPRKMGRIFRKVPRCAFHGHTHIPGVLRDLRRRYDDKIGRIDAPDEEAGRWEFHTPDEAGGAWSLDDFPTMINVGSVGQPRDGDWRASYALFDGATARFRRVEYDVETTIRKIYDVPELENFLGDRLRDGR